jgi:hypothetical protein
MNLNNNTYSVSYLNNKMPSIIMAHNRPIISSGSYNLNFVDWDNEFDSVTDHMSNIAGN